MWVLKEERHRGKGVHVMPLEEAVQKAKVRKFEGNYDVAQAYIANQMTVAGRKFYVRSAPSLGIMIREESQSCRLLSTRLWKTFVLIAERMCMRTSCTL